MDNPLFSTSQSEINKYGCDIEIVLTDISNYAS